VPAGRSNGHVKYDIFIDQDHPEHDHTVENNKRGLLQDWRVGLGKIIQEIPGIKPAAAAREVSLRI
jgi:hypothetical protein